MTNASNQISRLTESVTAIENWSNNNISPTAKIPTGLLDTSNLGLKVIIRLNSRLETYHSEEVTQDYLLNAKALLTLKYIIAYDKGFRFNEQAANDYPDLSLLASCSEQMLVNMGNEAVNTINTLDKKYPY